MKVPMFFLAAMVCVGAASPSTAQTCVNPPSGLVGWWPGDGNANDISGYNNNGTTNGATFAAGEVGQAFSLDGANDYVGSIGTGPTYSFIQDTGVFTIMAWIQIPHLGSHVQQAITGNTATTSEKGHFFIWDNSGGVNRFDLRLMNGTSGVPVIDSSSGTNAIRNTNWHHVAAVGDGTHVTFWIDGVATLGTGTIGTLSTGNSSGPLAIGSCLSSAPQFQFDGQIDEVQIYNRALTGSEIQGIYGAGSLGVCKPCQDVDQDGYVDCTTACVLQPGQSCGDCRDDDPTVHPGALETTCNGIDDDCDGLIDEDFPGGCQCAELGSGVVSWWPANGNATDIRSGQNCTLMNSATLTTGEVGQAFSLNGVDGYVRVPHNPSLDPGPGSFTVAAWVRTSVTVRSQAVLSKYECGGYCPSGIATPRYEVYVLSGGRPSFILRDLDSQTMQSITGPASVADGAWHHLAAERDMSAHTMSLYVDGLRVVSNPLTSSADGIIGDSDGEPDPLTLGAHVIGGSTVLTDFFSGALDEVMYFNRALSTAEIQAIHAAGSAGMCPCIDNDRDGYGEFPGVACAAGTQLDCDDSHFQAHLGGLDVTCNGVDEDCDGKDGPAIAPGVVTGLRVLSNKVNLTWDTFTDATSYDVAKGDLIALRQSGGNFTTSLLPCLEERFSDTLASDVSVPPPGAGFFYVVRYENVCNTYSSYDSGASSQIGSRDSEIAANCSSSCHLPTNCPADYSCAQYGSLCCYDVTACSDTCHQCTPQCAGDDPSMGHCTTDSDCFPLACDRLACTPTNCFCDISGGWRCDFDCNGHCA